MKNTLTIGFLTLSLMSGLSYAQDSQQDLAASLARTNTSLTELNSKIELMEGNIKFSEDRKGKQLNTLKTKRNDMQEKVDIVNNSIESAKESVDNLQKEIANDKSMMRSNERRMDAIANYESNASDLSSSIASNKNIGMRLQKQFDDFSNDFNAHKQFTDGAIAGAAAMTMLTVPKGIGNTALSAAGSYYNGQSGLALGVTHRINSVTIRAGATYNTGSKEPSISATIGYDF